MTDNELSAINNAKHYHKDQKWGNSPYFVHLSMVANIIKVLPNCSEDLIIAGYLHDILEDTDVDMDHIQFTFGYTVAKLVQAVTNPPKSEIMFKNKQERNEHVYDKIDDVGMEAYILKTADRISNLIMSSSTEDFDHLMKYCREDGEFRRRIANKLIREYPSLYDTYSSLISICNIILHKNNFIM